MNERIHILMTAQSSLSNMRWQLQFYIYLCGDLIKLYITF